MGTQSDPCCSSATPSLTLNPKTYRLQRGSYVAPSSPSSFFSPLLKTAAQDGGVQDQAELPRGLLGSDQQADQHGILRLLCLSLHVFLLLARRPGPAWLCGSLCEGVRGGERAWDEADGLSEQERWSLCLPGYRQAGEHGVGQLPRGNGGRPGAGEDGEPELARDHQGRGRQGRLSPLGLCRRVLGGSGGLHQEHRRHNHKAEEGRRRPWPLPLRQGDGCMNSQLKKLAA